MRIPPSTLGLLALTAGLVGCNQTGGFRAVAPSDVKTTASVGDQALPVVAGLPGEARRAADVTPQARRGTARISGRVYDEEGEPVRNAVVRLAMSGVSGGKLIHATTDRSGAFTLRDVRPGSTYTVIAEYQGEQGMMTGRASAEAPDTELTISLHPRDSIGSQGGAVAAAPSASRVRPVARADEADDSGFAPAEEPAARPRASRAVRPRLAAQPEEFEDPSPADSSPRADDPLDESFEEDGENPLPPAREISKVSAQSDDLPGTRAGGDGAPRSLPDNFIEGGRNSKRASGTEAPKEARARPTWSEIATAEGTDVPLDEQVSQTNAFRREAPAPVAATIPAETIPEPPAVAETEPPAVAEPESPKVVEPLQPAVASAPAVAPRPTGPADLNARRKAPYCDYDGDERQILRFAMLDIDGKKVSLDDFDADLILLDFWGSWCVQCGPALEHMKELQSRLGGKKLQVISIAYEKTAKEGRAQKLAEVARAMGLNFPVLMTDFSDPCPVREALAVDVFPTMILLDREGRILRRERGATAVTLGNIDRAIADHFERANKPQYARREPRGRATR